ncbi:MAG: hypothetical protein WDZ79_02930 [Candidatus Paceibacterota bacterium]
MTINDLAKIISKGFSNMEEQFESLENCMGRLEERQDETEVRLSQQINGVNNRLDDLALNRATRDELYTANKRLDRVEKKVGLKKH